MTNTTPSSPFNAEDIRAQFPILTREINGKPLAYLDNAASAQTPTAVIDALTHQYTSSYANVHRGLHTLANETTDAFETARATAAQFLGAQSPNNIVFTSGGTGAMNIAAMGLAHMLQEEDEIILSVAEHHSNIVPWHFLREKRGAVIKWVGLTSDGALDLDDYKAKLSPRTKIVSLTHMSNVMGTITRPEDVVGPAHAVGAKILMDGCQAGVHLPMDVTTWGVDYYVLTGHKIYGPNGIGVLYGTDAALEALEPSLGGGEMIETVSQEGVSFAPPPARFEPGTPPIIPAIGLGAAMRWLRQYDLAEIHAHEMALYEAAAQKLSAIDGLKIHGTSPQKGAVLSFSIDGVHPHDIAQILDNYGVAIRAGQHCANPLMDYLGVHATARASFAAYNTLSDVDQLAEGLAKAVKMLRM